MRGGERIMNLKKMAIGLVSALLLSTFAVPAFAAPAFHENAGATVNPSSCDTSGAPIVNLTWKAINDYDSGVAGNAWANDSLNRSLKVYDLGGGTYCAVVKDAGQFVSFAGQSPLVPSVTIGAGIKGTIDGGYIGTFTANSFNSQLQTNGSLGTIDYQCTSAYTCANAFDWLSTYFGGVTNFNQPYWAWNYHAGNNGSMVQSSNGYQGNITGN